jgi:hypothetical protein
VEPLLFCDDDAGYRTWLPANPGAYVLNCESLGSLSDAKLHRAGCRDLVGPLARNQRLTVTYRKYCSSSLEALERLTPVPVGHCQHCLAD